MILTTYQVVAPPTLCSNYSNQFLAITKFNHTGWFDFTLLPVAEPEAMLRLLLRLLAKITMS